MRDRFPPLNLGRPLSSALEKVGVRRRRGGERILALRAEPLRRVAGRARAARRSRPRADQSEGLLRRYSRPDQRWVVDVRSRADPVRALLHGARHGPVHPPRRRLSHESARGGADNVVGAPEQAIWARKECGDGLAGLVRHSDHGSQYLSIA